MDIPKISSIDDNAVLKDNHVLEIKNSTVSSVQEKQKDSEMKPTKVLIVVAIFAVMAGVATGFGSFRLFAKSGMLATTAEDQLPTTAVEGKVAKGDVFGSKDATFDSNAEGYLEEGGIEGEGSHKLLRAGGPSQTVYLTSSIVDLDQFAGMEVKIWGETFKSQKAGWFMDVGRVEVLVVNGEAPQE